jgi:TRAP-type transport system periplasmic protein
MKPATVVRNLLLAALLSASASHPAGAEQEFRITHEFAANLDSRDRATRVFIAEAVKRAPHLKFALYPESGLKIPASRYFAAMATGELSMSVVTLAFAADTIPELAITMFPFIPADIDMAARLKGTAFHRRLQQFAETQGIHILTWWWMPGAIASQRADITGPQTVKGLKVRMAGGGMAQLFATAGAQMTPFSPAAEHLRRMKAGEFDFALTSVESQFAFKMYDQARFATIGGLGSFMSLQPLAISKTVWDGLTLDERTAFEDAADVADQYFETEQRDILAKAQEAYAKAGAKVRTLGIDDYEAWTRLAKDNVWPAFRQASPAADELFVALITSAMKARAASNAGPGPAAPQPAAAGRR